MLHIRTLLWLDCQDDLNFPFHWLAAVGDLPSRDVYTHTILPYYDIIALRTPCAHHLDIYRLNPPYHAYLTTTTARNLIEWFKLIVSVCDPTLSLISQLYNWFVPVYSILSFLFTVSRNCSQNLGQTWSVQLNFVIVSLEVLPGCYSLL